MRTLIICSMLGLSAALLVAEEGRRVTYVDLGPKANQKLKESYGNEGNNLINLPLGEQTFGGVRFKIADGLIQLSSKNVTDKPAKVEGIKVNATFSKLYL